MSPDDLAARLAADPDAAGLLLDFDGTLAPIVDDPAAARMPEGLDSIVGALAERLALVAVVSGRPAAFLAEQFDHPRVRLLGLYGLEEWAEGAVRADEEAAPWEDVVAAARDRLRQAVAGEAGVAVEDKGLAVAVHWRNAPDRQRAAEEVEQLVAAVAQDSGLKRAPGKLVEELRPPAERDKGVVVRSLVANGGLRPVYVGDDRGDLPAFAAAREAGGWALAVDHGEETPPEVLGAADAVVHGAEGVAAWLSGLHERVTETGKMSR